MRKNLGPHIIIHEVAHAWLHKAGVTHVSEAIRQILAETKFTGVRPKPEEFAGYPKNGLLTAWCTISPEEVVAEMAACASIFDPASPQYSPFSHIDKQDLRFLNVLKLILRESFITPKAFVRVSRHIKP